MSSYFRVLQRPYPAYVNGELIDYNFDFKTGNLSVHWIESPAVKEPTMIFIPKILELNIDKLRASVEASINTIENSVAGWLSIAPLGEGNERKVILHFFMKKQT